MTYQKPSVFVIDKDLVESLLPVYEVACHCTGSGVRAYALWQHKEDCVVLGADSNCICKQFNTV